MVTSYIGLGSNLSNPIKQVQQAILVLNTLPQSEVVNTSSLYVSRPMGPQDQPDYINAVIALKTQLSPLALLDALQTIEKKAGRIRKANRWGARILDLDILLYGNKIMNNERLTIPHYGLKLREFVLLPLAEIAPNVQLPEGDIIQTLANNIEKNNLRKL